MPRGYTDPVAGAVDAWVPMDLSEGRDASNADNHYVTVIARLRGGVSLERAQAELDALGATLAKQYPAAKNTIARLYPLKEERGHTQAQQRVISGDFFRVVGIPLLEGRLFDAQDDAGAPDRAVISKSLALRLFPGMSAIGQRIAAGGRESEIIGVVGDAALDNEGGDAAYVYHSHRQWAGDRVWALTQVVSLTTTRDAVERPIARAIASADPELVLYKPAMLDDVIGRGVAQRVLTLRILLVFAVIAIVLSALGLFGVLSFSVRLRAREFGIRMALGADAAAVRRMVLRKGFAVTLVGLAFGLVGALATSRLIASLLFHVSPLDPRVVAGSIVLMGVVAAIAAYLPARRATSTDPLSVLGAE
jgi:hypothetical protein